MRTDFENQEKEKYIMFWKIQKGLFIIAALAALVYIGYFVAIWVKECSDTRQLAERREQYDQIVDTIAQSENVEFSWYGAARGNTDSLGGFKYHNSNEAPYIVVNVHGHINGESYQHVATLKMDGHNGILLERDFREMIKRFAVITRVDSPNLADVLGIPQEELPFNPDIR